VGPGRMGLSLGSVLAASEYARELLFVGRRERPPEHPVLGQPLARYSRGFPGAPPEGTRVLLAVPDSTIAEIAVALARLGAPGDGCVALHLSGLQPAGVLAPLGERGYAVGSLHPLQTVADPHSGRERLRGAFFTFEGNAQARGAAAEIVEAAGGRLLEVHTADKARYHAACVFASNYVVACVAVATRLLAGAANIGREEAAQALQPLWRGALQNLGQLGIPRALTGPVARGDLETVRGHLAALDADTRDLYRQLALQVLDLSRELGLDAAVGDAIEAEIRGLKGE